eukprot:SRR837773.12447.p1 GENE.SRR837773.12447~~SRR837773.12447.p1  ORF type:complete len:415 (+),score=120.38 SRR837773.12447:187-1245(+)
MGQTSEELNVKFVLNTGDNFYYCGVQNLTDDQFKVTFEDVFTAKSLMVPWYGVLGNHDYAYDAESQFKYKSPNNDRWQIPGYYYTKRLALDATHSATVIFIDTNPCIQSYRDSDPNGWDPCSGKYGECKETADNTCHFHEHILAQDCSKQLAWFKQALAAVPKDDWLIVVGHHEADQVNVEDFTAEILASPAALYLNGHTHAMKHYQVDGRTDIDFVTTGAGCMVATHDQETCPVNGTCTRGVQNGHQPNELYFQQVAAFSTHTFAEDFSSLTTKFFDITGKVLHQFTTQKRSGSAPAPAPSPAPAAASCSTYGCGKYNSKHSCQCNDNCDSYGNCCSDYADVCGQKTQLIV